MAVKTVWTSYYGRAKQLPESVMQISISRGTPNWWKHPLGRNLLIDAAPSAELLKASKDPAFDYEPVYLAEVEPKLDEIYKQIPDGAILFCWEKNPAECHRSLLFKLLEDNFDVVGGEVPDQNSKKRIPLLSQLSLL